MQALEAHKSLVQFVFEQHDPLRRYIGRSQCKPWRLANRWRNLYLSNLTLSGGILGRLSASLGGSQIVGAIGV